MLGGIDEDVLGIFISLPSYALEGVFKKYERLYGKPAGDYARSAFPKWKSGATKVSGQTAERLINLVPEYLTRDQQYDLLKKLYEKLRHEKQLSVQLIIDQENVGVLQAIDNFVTEVCAAPDLQSLPAPVADRISWVCNQDSSVARKLMAAFETEESLQIAKVGKLELAHLIASVQQLNATAVGWKTINFPHGTLQIQVGTKAHLRSVTGGAGCLVILLAAGFLLISGAALALAREGV